MTTATSEKTFGIFIDGRELAARSGETFPVLNPMDGSVIGFAARGGIDEIDAAVKSARAAFPKWANLAAGDRERILLKAAEALEAQHEPLLDLLIDESGSTINKARYEVNFSPSLLRTAAGEARRLYAETFPHDRPTRMSFVVREPLGVVAAIVPFNAPLALLVKMVAFPLAAGNTVVVKPSEETPLIAVEFARLMYEAGLPAGVLNVVTGFGSESGEPLVNHPDVAGIALTGSTATGIKVGEAGIRGMKRMQLELGGKNPLIVLGDVDPVAAAQIACDGLFVHAGQICMANSRVLVERSIAEPFISTLVEKAASLHLGDLRDERTAYGPVINENALNKISAHVEQAVSLGAQLLTGGKVRHRLVYEPTILLDPPPNCAAWCEETFGPVMNVVIVENLHEAIQRANESDYGLSGAILTNDVQRAFTAARQLRCGSVHIGMHPFQSNALAPIGGYGMSGLGKSGGQYSIEEFTELKWISVEIGTLPVAE